MQNNEYSKSHKFIINLVTPENRKLSAFVDGGSDISLLKPLVFNILSKTENIKLSTTNRKVEVANKTPLNILGSCNISFVLNGKVFSHEVLISDDASFPGAMLLGADILNRFKSICNRGNKTLTLSGHVFNFRSVKQSDYKCVRLINHAIPRELNIRTKGIVKIPPLTNSCVQACTDFSFRNEQNILITDKMNCTKVKVAKSINKVNKNNNVTISILNLTEHEIVLPNNTNVATATLVEEQEEDELPAAANLETNLDCIDDQIKKLNLDHLCADKKGKIINLIREFSHAFSTDDNPIGEIKDFSVPIPTEEGKIAYKPQYRVPQSHKEPLDKIIKELVKFNIIEPAEINCWNSPVLLVTKPHDPPFMNRMI